MNELNALLPNITTVFWLGLALLLVLVLFGFLWQRSNVSPIFRAPSRNQALKQATKQTSDWIIYYASQRGRAKTLALQTAKALETGGLQVDVIALSTLKPQDLLGKTQCLFITSTFGNGQAPEAARSFERKLKRAKLNLSDMNYAVLALGDRQYDRFCGFGRKLDTWLTQQNAQPIRSIIRVSQMDTDSVALWIKLIDDVGGNIQAFSILEKQ